MGVVRRLERLLGGESDGSDAEDEDPSHVCRTCGREYFTDPGADIDTCRDCGGVKVEPV